MTVIDFFGGSGLLSQWCIEAGFKHVVWNDFDDYQGRIRYYMTDRYRITSTGRLDISTKS